MSFMKGSEMPSVFTQRLAELVRTGQQVQLIDVRTPAEFRKVHIPFARNVPLNQLDHQSLWAGRHGADEPLYVVCRTGNRAAKACEKLHAAGRTNVVNVEGGTLAWEQAGLPVVRGKKTISLERQVRISAGLLVLVGSGLAVVAHPYWTAFSAFVGAGLTFSGTTDTCGMAMLLAKMPWNQVQAAGTIAN